MRSERERCVRAEKKRKFNSVNVRHVERIKSANIIDIKGKWKALNRDEIRCGIVCEGKCSCALVMCAAVLSFMGSHFFMRAREN
jgi:hypothetical protein